MIRISTVPSPPLTAILPPDRPRRSSMFVLSRSPRQRIVLFTSAGFVAESRRTMCQREDPLAEFQLLARLRFLARHCEFQLLCAANHEERRLVADAFFSQQLVQIFDAGDGPIVEADDDVAFAQPRFLARALLFKRHHENAG